MLSFDAAASASKVRVPVLHVRSIVSVDVAKFRSVCPSLVVEETKGVGHYSPLEAPRDVNRLIEAFLDGVARAA
jgi:hypothetical protein